MRLLHTSDLHYGALWRGVSRRTDQDRVLEEILGLCEARDVDVLLIAGDVFSDRVEGPLAEVARRLLERLAPRLRLGMGVFLLRGNHDNYHLFQLMRVLTAEMAGGPGRWPLVVADAPGLYELPGQRQIVVALPHLYPGLIRMRTSDVELPPEEQVAGLNGFLAQKLRALYESVPSDRPSIFTAHFLVEGVSLTTDLAFETGYHRDLKIRPADLPHFTSYNALGHIHLGQRIGGATKPSWYSGAPERLELGERAYEPSVLLVDVPETPGGEARVDTVRIEGCTPFVHEVLEGQEAVDRFCASVPSPDPLGEVVASNIAVSIRGAVQAQIHQAAPRVQLRWAVAAMPAATSSDGGVDPNDVSRVVREFLEDRFGEDPARRGRLVAAFERLWAEEEAVLAEVSA